MPKHKWEPFDEDGHNMICIQCHQYISYHNPEEWNQYIDADCIVD